MHIPIAVHPDPSIGPSSIDQRLDALIERKQSLSPGLLMPPESDRNVEDLLSDVLDGMAAPTNDTASHSVELSGTEQDGTSNEAETAHSKAAPEGPDLAAIPDSPEPGQWAQPPPAKRPILQSRFQSRPPKPARRMSRGLFSSNMCAERRSIGLRFRISIVADDQARARLVNFVHRFLELTSRLDAVQIVTYDADSIQTRDLESTDAQRGDLETRWQRMLEPVSLHLSQKSRRSGGDLHDRFARARFDNGDTVIWDLGRGIDGVMNAKWPCVVNVFEERVRRSS